MMTRKQVEQIGQQALFLGGVIWLLSIVSIVYGSMYETLGDGQILSGLGILTLIGFGFGIGVLLCGLSFVLACAKHRNAHPCPHAPEGSQP